VIKTLRNFARPTPTAIIAIVTIMLSNGTPLPKISIDEGIAMVFTTAPISDCKDVRPVTARVTANTSINSNQSVFSCCIAIVF
jgi:hypothetical protein